jgi:hypothetical protein
VLRSVVGFIAGANRMPFANFMIANSAGAAWALFYGLGAGNLRRAATDWWSNEDSNHGSDRLGTRDLREEIATARSFNPCLVQVW